MIKSQNISTTQSTIETTNQLPSINSTSLKENQRSKRATPNDFRVSRVKPSRRRRRYRLVPKNRYRSNSRKAKYDNYLSFKQKSENFCSRYCRGICRNPEANRTKTFMNLFNLSFENKEECFDMARGVCRSSCYVCLKSKTSVAGSSYCKFFN